MNAIGSIYTVIIAITLLVCSSVNSSGQDASHEQYSKTADSLYTASKLAMEQGELDSAEMQMEKFIELCLDRNDSLRLIRGYYYYGDILKHQSMFELAIDYARKSIDYFFRGMDPKLQISVFNNMGTIFRNINEYDSAAIYYLKALTICEKQEDLIKIAIVVNNLGDVYLETGHFETAEEYYNKALAINLENEGGEASIAMNYINLGRLAVARENYPQAEEFYRKAQEIHRSLGDSLSIYHSYNNFGDLYYNQEKYSLALDYFKNAYQGYRGVGFIKGIVVAMGNLTATNLALGNYNEAIRMNDSCVALTLKIGNKDLRMDAYKNMSENLLKTGDYKGSREYLDKYIILKDSIYEFKRSKLIYDLVIKYEKEKNEARILTLEKENLQKTIQRNSILYSGLGLLIMALFAVIFFRHKSIKDRIISQQMIRQLEEEKKLMIAKMMIEGQEEERKRIARELHDGLGVLLSATKMQFTCIKDTSPENRPMIDKAIQLLEQASGDVRKISHNMMPGLLTKLGFYEAIEDLFDNLNDAGNLQAVLEINGSQERLPENREIMLYRIVQEMVNNTLKYAEAGLIKLIINVYDEYMTMAYSDDGKGFDADKVLAAESSSLGLKSIQSRVNFLNGEVALDSRPGKGVKYSFQIPNK